MSQRHDDNYLPEWVTDGQNFILVAACTAVILLTGTFMWSFW